MRDLYIINDLYERYMAKNPDGSSRVWDATKAEEDAAITAGRIVDLRK